MLKYIDYEEKHYIVTPFKRNLNEEEAKNYLQWVGTMKKRNDYRNIHISRNIENLYFRYLLQLFNANGKSVATFIWYPKNHKKKVYRKSLFHLFYKDERRLLVRIRNIYKEGREIIVLNDQLSFESFTRYYLRVDRIRLEHGIFYFKNLNIYIEFGFDMATFMNTDEITKDHINILKKNKMNLIEVTCIDSTAFVPKYNYEDINLD